MLSRGHITTCLTPLDLAADPQALPMTSDADLSKDWQELIPDMTQLRDAAVLVPIVERRDGPTVLLTQRSPDMPSHAGQVAFPGGRIDDTDAGPIEAALREAQEEVALNPDWVDVAGLLHAHVTGSGYRIIPVVGFVEPSFEVHDLIAEPGEVAKIFEVPLSFLMDPENHKRHSLTYKGRERFYYAMPYEDNYIWGATAAMLMTLYRTISKGEL